MFVDDEKDSRDLLEDVLSLCKAEIFAVASAAEALEKISEFNPEVIISDIGMPEQDGYELIREIEN